MTETQSAGNQRHKSSLVETSETTRVATYSKSFCEWLAGLIDGDGSLQVSKKGYTSLEITMGLQDLPCLRYIQNKLGGSIKMRSGVKAYRYRLHNKQGMINLINCINGHIRHTSRLQQLHRVCQILEISVTYPTKLDTESYWFAGFFDACGMLDYKISDNNTKPFLYVKVTHRLYDIITLFKNVFGGYVYMDFGGNGRYVWCLESKDQLLKFFECVNAHKLRTSKRKKFFLVSEFYSVIDLEAYPATPQQSKDIMLKKVWFNFHNRFHRNLHTDNCLNRINTNLDNNNKLVAFRPQDRPALFISNKSMDSLRKIVLPYMDDSMLYKVNSISYRKAIIIAAKKKMEQ